jgi:hypothetical protein
MIKKIGFFVVMAAIIAAFGGCQKENLNGQLADEVQPQFVVNDLLFEGLNEIAFSVEDNRLVFESEEEFQKCIDFLAQLGDENFPKFEKEIGFDSYRKIFQNDPEKSALFPDELFQTILNPNMEAIVGKYLLWEDPINQKTYTYKLSSKCGDLKSAEILNKYEFDSNANIFDLLRGVPDLKSTYCDGDKLGYYYWNTSAGQVQYKIVYQTGFYKSLQAKIKKDHSGGAEYISLETDWTETTFYRNKNGCWTYSGSDGGYGREYNLRPYYSTKRLKAYRYKIYFYCNDYGYTPSVIHNATLKIACKESNGC